LNGFPDNLNKKSNDLEPLKKITTPVPDTIKSK